MRGAVAQRRGSIVSSYLSVSRASDDVATRQRYRVSHRAARISLNAAIADYAWLPSADPTGNSRGTATSTTVEATDSPWVTIVWDDPVNLMNYVTYVFQKLFGYSEPHATKLMLQVHNEGKAVVSAGSRESMEVDVSKLHAAGLWATMQQDR